MRSTEVPAGARPGAIHAVQALAVPHQREEVAADAVDGGLDHSQRDRRGQDGVHGRPAALQHGQTSLRRQWLTGRHHATPGHYGHAPRRIGVVREVHRLLRRVEGRDRTQYDTFHATQEDPRLPGPTWGIGMPRNKSAARGGSSAAPPHNLSDSLTSFIGREDEVVELCQLLRSGARCVTLIGPGGVGKTRLALQVAAILARPPNANSRQRYRMASG